MAECMGGQRVGSEGHGVGVVVDGLVEPAPRKGVMVAFPRWIGDAGHVGRLCSNSYGGGLAWVGLENNGVEFADAVGVA